jgi:hypothetical protein
MLNEKWHSLDPSLQVSTGGKNGGIEMHKYQ